ncbi:TrmH family RNA methyltransferase [Candidatus Leptofilum sp.]|uniref:TrmH family RNA methyltransferase n=1 Tax=Candidatus Leptofilum sp. TaxID=3241576 RepID=UPI003B5A5B8E
MTTLLTSLQNARIKNILKLQNRRHRDAQRRTVVEGIREINCALQSGIVPHEAYICPELLADAEGTAVYHQLQSLAQTTNMALFTITPALFAKAAYRGQSGGILLVIPYLDQTLASLSLSEAPLLLIIDGGEKPGNLGAILRTADAAGVDAVIVTSQPENRGTDIHNPNVIRASLGALFTRPILEAPADDLLAWLNQNQISVVTLTPDGERPYTQTNLRGKIALVMGSEAYGVHPFWLANAHIRLKILMRGTVDSLNLSAATAVVVFEAVRQRQETIPDSAQVH